jgi:tellurite resistance protein TerC
MDNSILTTVPTFAMWAGFFAFVGFLMFLDLGILNRKNHVISAKESIYTSLFYFAISLGFGGWMWYEMGQEKASLFITGYLIELSLSMDNIFVISLILTYFKIPREYQHRVLFWGIIGVIVLRGIMIAAGAAIVAEFHEVLYFFAAFLMFTGVKMLMMKDDGSPDIGENPVLKYVKKHMRVTTKMDGDKFFTYDENPKTGKIVRYATPLFLALCVVEFVDLIFAVDSIPAILAITHDPFIVYTSNIFAILGLRSLYFALSAMISRFHYMKYALALVLIFIGSKVFLNELFDLAKFPASVSLGVTVGLLAGGILFSLYKTRGQKT